ncbi:EAL and modified HD-GYP domain-containing signal transduction protein [Polaromonas sp. OV174]|uniref:EAL and HDOD domain-containing protein n=1 Tax=Polaromonas sp. OV174 TaxID=1855300 RepID=UPI0008F09D93|nr:HDOD domain-containing protein [Polaromonas sp. OV174]SFC06186.1 EAL and modified HD-GYP domain-containing signal transduction protein [Polaromonas sp. OV174]
MFENKFLVRVPLLDPMQQVIGYKLAWQKKENSRDSSSSTDLPQLLALVAEHFSNCKSGCLFLNAGLAAVSAEMLQNMSPQHTVLMLRQEDCLNAGNVASAMLLHSLGFGLVLCDVEFSFLTSNEALLPLLTHVEVSVGHPNLAAISNLTTHVQPPISLVMNQISDWREWDACAALGLSGFFGNLCFTPRALRSSGELTPQTVLILQLMQMVQENADVRHLEKVLKRDATLSYRLFRYINSASFGIEVEIQSLRHAVAMLGYTPLFRWLSLLLATTNAEGFSPALLQAAIVRGRFTELLGQNFLSKGESENLFVVGMFSLLDQLLGVPIQSVLKQILLPEAIAQALLTRDGMYGPFLALAEACEREHGCASDFADALFMTAASVNQMHLSALAWAQNLKI